MRPENFDLNLIRVFLAVARSRNVTQAGEALGITQSSVSHALARLRTLCNDRLFISTRDGMVPTALALRMVQPLDDALALATRTVQGLLPFDAARDSRCFGLVLSEIGELSYVPPLMEHLARHAPRITLDVTHLPMGEHYAALTAGTADMTIGTFPAARPGFHARALFAQPYVCMLRTDHPGIGDALSMEQYFAADHVTVDPPGRGPGIVEQALQALGRERRIVLRLPHFLAGPVILQRCHFLMTVPAWTWEVLGRPPHIRCLPLPFDTEAIVARMVWHERSHGDPGHRWLRGLVTELLADPALAVA